MLRLLSPNNVLEPELKSMGRDLSPFFLLPSLDLLSRQMSHGTDWRPSADILEHTDGYRIVVELPGVTRDDVNVSMDKGVLTISGERKRMMEDETSSKDANAGFRDGHVWHRREIHYGHFSRSFTIPEDADKDSITASIRDGMLVVHLKKEEKSLPKVIDVRVDHP